VRDFIDKNGFTFTVLLDPEWQLESLFGIMAYPTSIFVDKDGIIRHRVVGGVVPSELDEYLTSIGVGE
jgi:peroxiredoxin